MRGQHRDSYKKRVETQANSSEEALLSSALIRRIPQDDVKWVSIYNREDTKAFLPSG